MLLCLTVGLSTFAILLSKSLVLALGYGTDCTFILMILVSFTLKKKKKKKKKNSVNLKPVGIIVPLLYFTVEAPTCFDSYNQPRLGGGWVI